MKQIDLTVNGKPVSALVDPRQHLADFLRENLLLTGTHLGCEHGVCGACTLLLDGEPVRSCIAYAVACDGADVLTIEGLDDDAVMTRLRNAMSQHHGLQCGYCTPGVLVTARDIVVRLPDADAHRVREELSGHLCRCTGYVGIVNAIRAVLEEHRGERAEQQNRLVETETVATRGRQGRRRKNFKPTMQVKQQFVVAHPRALVWDYFGRIEDVTPCLPGASLLEPASGNLAKFKLKVRLGPIGAEFVGEAELKRAANFQGRIRGSGRDDRSNSRVKGEMEYTLSEEVQGKATRVDLSVDFSLTGRLAQFGRTGIVNDLAARLTADFANNLDSALSAQHAPGEPASARQSSDPEATGRTTELDVGGLFVSVIWSRIKALLRSILGRS